MMDKIQLVNLYESGVISKQQLGQLRRITLESLIDKILSSDKEAGNWLDSKKSKLCTKKIAVGIGYGTEPVNIRQSFRLDLNICEKKLQQRGIIINESKTTKEIGDANVQGFLKFVNTRLESHIYQWPINKKGALYRKAIWAYFLDIPVVDVSTTPEMFSRNEEVKGVLLHIDKMIAEGTVKTLDHSAEAALDEVLDNMTSRSISTLRQQLKEVREKYSFEREEKKRLATENHELRNSLSFYEQKDRALLSGNGVDSLKKAGAH
jgi:hypothetical protein